MKQTILILACIVTVYIDCSGQLFDSNGFVKDGVIVFIKSLATNKYLTVHNISNANSTPIVQHSLTRQDNQKFKFELVANSCPSSPSGGLSSTDCHIYKIRSVRSGKLLDIKGSSQQNGAPLVQYSDNGGHLNQRFYIWTKGNFPSIFIRTAITYGQKTLDVPGGSSTENLKVIQYTENNTNNQRFILEIHN